MWEDEYPALIEKGALKFYFENAFTRRFNLTDTEKSVSAIVKATKARAENTEF
ncbi:MAG: hypothetical protein LBL79_12555 [Prevotella sp.]|jgi:hypothetical protein|nr:hypothetical protein [Prevotella sp.]